MVNLKMFLEAEMHRKETCSLGSGKKMDRDNVDTHVRTHTHAQVELRRLISTGRSKDEFYGIKSLKLDDNEVCI